MRKSRIHELRHEDFVKAALRVIARKGLVAASVREVAREADCSAGALRHYFKSKDELLEEVSNYLTQTLRESMRQTAGQLTGVKAIRDSLYAVLPMDEERHGLWRIWFALLERSPHNTHIKELAHKRYKDAQIYFARLIKHAKDVGEVPAGINVSMAADSAITLMDGIGMRTLVEDGVPSPERQRKQVNRWIEDTLRPNVRGQAK